MERLILDNVIPVFHLPNVVFFPRIRMPFHIFEPRYVKMIEDILSGSKLIGIFLLKEGWQKTYFKNPEFYDIGCVGKLVGFTEVPGQEKRYNIVVEGLFRARATEVIKAEDENSYQKVRFEILSETYPPPSEQFELKRKLIEVASEYMKNLGEKEENIQRIKFTAESLDFESLINWAIILHPISPHKRQKLIEKDLKDRAVEIMNIIEEDNRNYKIIADYRNSIPKDPRVN